MLRKSMLTSFKRSGERLQRKTTHSTAMTSAGVEHLQRSEGFYSRPASATPHRHAREEPKSELFNTVLQDLSRYFPGQNITSYQQSLHSPGLAADFKSTPLDITMRYDIPRKNSHKDGRLVADLRTLEKTVEDSRNHLISIIDGLLTKSLKGQAGEGT